MADERNDQPSFSPYRKFGIALHVGFVLAVVLAVVVMVNYLSQDYFFRWHLSSNTRNELSPRTVAFLRSLTNHVKVTLYYDKDETLYSSIADLLLEYQRRNSRISVQMVDYLRDPAAAQKVKADYKLTGANDKDLIIFECEDGLTPSGEKRFKVIAGKDLAQYTIERVRDEKTPYRNKLVGFEGEKMFTATLIAVTNLKPLRAYFLTGHNEHKLDSGDELSGYLQFSVLLQQNYVQVEPLSLVGTNAVPDDCNLLVVAGPTTGLLDSELEKLDGYLNKGGRMLALFNANGAGRETGLESLLAKWGVGVGNDVAVDPDHSAGQGVVVSAFSRHPVVARLYGTGIYMLRPRPVWPVRLTGQPADAPRVEVLASTCTNSFLFHDNTRRTMQFPLMVALEKGAVKDVVTEKAATRIIVIGDSYFLGNNQLDLLANRDFAGFVANWLLERPQLLQGITHKPVNEYRFVMTRGQFEKAQWLLLAGMPGGVLLLGSIVWLRRRK